MNLDELRTVRRNERQRDSLQHLRDSFYADVAAYIKQLKDERDRAATSASDPFADPDVGRLTDEIQAAEDIVEAIYERRVGKVVKHASFVAADMPAETDGLTDEERLLFSDLVDRIRQNRTRVLETLAGDDPVEGDPAVTEAEGETDSSLADPGESRAPSSESETPPPPPEDPSTWEDGAAVPGTGAEDPTEVLAEVMGSDSDGDGDSGDDADSEVDDDSEVDAGAEASTRDGSSAGDGTGPDAGTAERGGTERTTVRITEDVGAILGVDEREYDLAAEDVVTLPTPNAEPLIDRDAAEPLE